MGLRSGRASSESRFSAYVEALTAALGHADRAKPFRSYCTGLLLPGPRKSVEPMAARIEPARVQAAHQSLHHLVANVHQATGDGIAEASLASDHLARRHQHPTRLSLCCRAGPARASRLQPHQPQTRGMVSDRMAKGRSDANQILALNAA